MATKIQVSRGSLHARGVNDLLRGELFYVPANANNDKDKGFKDNPNFPWDEGTLYIGNPTLNPDGKPDAPIAIAGARAYKSLVYQGQLSKTVKDISDPAFTHVRTGDFFIFKEDPEEGRFFEEGFRSGDLLVITSAQYPIAPDIANGEPDTSSNIAYTRITGSAGEAKNVHYDDSKTNLNVNNVQDAIDNLANNKITYKGTIEGDFTLAAIMSSVDNGIGNTDYLESGSLYFVDKDGIPFYNNEKKQIKISKKGDFVLWDKEKGWTLIPSGLSDAKDIDFDPTEAVKQQRDLGTFTEDKEEHILSTGNLKDLQSAVTYLLSHKAMLDSDGKVPLSQLHGTVLGAMQYCGTWDPIFDAQGVNNPDFQNNWPTGKSYESDDEEVSSLNNNHPGDYYIVKTSFTDIKYYDKASAKLEDGTHLTSYILNNGDYIIYTVPRNEKGDYIADKGHWEIIDNSATITSLNFNINGQHDGSEYDYLKDTKEVSIVGNPTFAADGKLVLVQDDNKLTFAGVRLIDQADNDPNKGDLDTYVPVYTGETNTLKRGSIKNNFNSLRGRQEVHTNADLYVGEKDIGNSANAYISGDVYLNPHFNGSTDPINSSIIFRVANTTYTTGYFEGKLSAKGNTEDGAEIFLPNKSSDIIGKIKGVTLLKDRLTKSTVDGYIESTSIEEHMLNGNAISIEFHAPDVYVNNTNTRKITLGNSDNTVFPKGKFDETEKTSSIISNPDQVLTDIINKLPKTPGTLLNDTDWKNFLTGTKGTLPIYDEDKEDKNKKTLIDSKVKQISGSLYDTLFQSSSKIGAATRTLDKANIYSSDYTKLKDSDFANKVYGEKFESTNPETGEVEIKYKGTDENIVLTTDTVIGDIEKDLNGKSTIKTPRSLLVSKSLVVGNGTTNNTHIVPGRSLFGNSSSQYIDPRTNTTRPVEDVYLELPSASGVLLSDNSVIDGGFFIENN